MEPSFSSRNGRLVWSGVDCVDLAERFGTPVYVLSEDILRERAGILKRAFLDKWERVRVAYAGKAFLTLAMARLADRLGLALDVVSGGELDTALEAGFPPERIFFHGSAKTRAELEFALSCGVGRIIVDGLEELDFLETLAREKRTPQGGKVAILLRCAPGVDSHTHQYISTGGLDSKFGFPLSGEAIERAVTQACASDVLDLKGYHFHIGSQIYENASHVMAVGNVIDRAASIRDKFGFCPSELNMGGGFGIPMAEGDAEPALESFTDAMMDELERRCNQHGLARPEAIIEPGRWIVGPAGITLYTVQTVKEIAGIKTYVSVDGGMADNPRPALYGAHYTACVANRMDEPATEMATLAGRYCESGDVLIENWKAPRVKRGDIVAVLQTGAYNFSMASNYNRVPRPGVLLVSGGESEWIVRPQTWRDVSRDDRIPERLRGAGE